METKLVTQETLEGVLGVVKTVIDSVDTKASQAQTTANSASTAAQNAQATATQASQAASAADTKATNAAGAAATADGKAVQAQTTANSASTAAQTAQTTAQNALNVANGKQSKLYVHNIKVIDDDSENEVYIKVILTNNTPITTIDGITNDIFTKSVSIDMMNEESQWLIHLTNVTFGEISFTIAGKFLDTNGSVISQTNTLTKATSTVTDTVIEL